MLQLDGVEAEATGARAIFDPVQGENLASRIYERAALETGARLIGPAVIVERETTTVITSTFDAIIQSEGSILLIRKGAQS